MLVDFQNNEVSFQVEDVVVLNTSGISKVMKPESIINNTCLFKIKTYVPNEKKYMGCVLCCDHKYYTELKKTHTIEKSDIDISETVKRHADELNFDMNDKKFNESLSHYLNHFMLTNESFA